jgi:hypothetical protein
MKKPTLLKKACDNCPFRKEGAIELNPGRLESIVSDLLSSDHNTFLCHKTVHSKHGGTWTEHGQYQHSGNESPCYGAMAYLTKCDRPNVQTRIAHATGMLDIKELRQDSEIINPIHLETN